jgi:hypothetical protein
MKYTAIDDDREADRIARAYYASWRARPRRPLAPADFTPALCADVAYLFSLLLEEESGRFVFRPET